MRYSFGVLAERMRVAGPWAAAAWGFSLGLDAAISAALVYRHTHAIALAALTGVAAVVVSAAALVVALRALAR